MRIKININYMILNIILLLPVTTLLQGLIPPINRVCFAGIILLLIVVLLHNAYKVKDVLVMGVLIVLYIWALSMTNGIAYNFNDYFYFLFFVLFSYFIVYKYEFFKNYCTNKKDYILAIIRMWNIIVLISMFFSTSYENGYFFSFTGDVFRLATSATFILSLLVLVVRQKKRYIMYAILPMYSLFFGGSRTYLVVGIVLFLFLIYIIAPSRRVFLGSIIPICLIMIAIIINSSIMNKITDTMGSGIGNDFYNDPFFTFTSGRSLFWVADMKAFLEGAVIKQLLGYGFNYVYDVNLVAINNSIWAHNDYINILLNFGLIGLGVYLYVFARMFKVCTHEGYLSAAVKGSLVFIWFFNAFFNMYYTYSCACASYPFIIIGITEFLAGRNCDNQKLSISKRRK